MPGSPEKASRVFNLSRIDIIRHALNTTQKATMIPTSADSTVTLPPEPPQCDT
jgi:hypothetical protein